MIVRIGTFALQLGCDWKAICKCAQSSDRLVIASVCA